MQFVDLCAHEPVWSLNVTANNPSLFGVAFKPYDVQVWLSLNDTGPGPVPRPAGEPDFAFTFPGGYMPAGTSEHVFGNVSVRLSPDDALLAERLSWLMRRQAVYGVVHHEVGSVAGGLFHVRHSTTRAMQLTGPPAREGAGPVRFAGVAFPDARRADEARGELAFFIAPSLLRNVTGCLPPMQFSVDDAQGASWGHVATHQYCWGEQDQDALPHSFVDVWASAQEAERALPALIDNLMREHLKPRSERWLHFTADPALLGSECRLQRVASRGAASFAWLMQPPKPDVDAEQFGRVERVDNVQWEEKTTRFDLTVANSFTQPWRVYGRSVPAFSWALSVEVDDALAACTSHASLAIFDLSLTTPADPLPAWLHPAPAHVKANLVLSHAAGEDMALRELVRCIAQDPRGTKQALKGIKRVTGVAPSCSGCTGALAALTAKLAPSYAFDWASGWGVDVDVHVHLDGAAELNYEVTIPQTATVFDVALPAVAFGAAFEGYGSLGRVVTQGVRVKYDSGGKPSPVHVPIHATYEGNSDETGGIARYMESRQKDVATQTTVQGVALDDKTLPVRKTLLQLVAADLDVTYATAKGDPWAVRVARLASGEDDGGTDAVKFSLDIEVDRMPLNARAWKVDTPELTFAPYLGSAVVGSVHVAAGTLGVTRAPARSTFRASYTMTQGDIGSLGASLYSWTDGKNMTMRLAGSIPAEPHAPLLERIFATWQAEGTLWAPWENKPNRFEGAGGEHLNPFWIERGVFADQQLRLSLMLDTAFEVDWWLPSLSVAFDTFGHNHVVGPVASYQRTGPVHLVRADRSGPAEVTVAPGTFAMDPTQAANMAASWVYALQGHNVTLHVSGEPTRESLYALVLENWDMYVQFVFGRWDGAGLLGKPDHRPWVPINPKLLPDFNVSIFSSSPEKLVLEASRIMPSFPIPFPVELGDVDVAILYNGTEAVHVATKEPLTLQPDAAFALDLLVSVTNDEGSLSRFLGQIMFSDNETRFDSQWAVGVGSPRSHYMLPFTAPADSAGQGIIQCVQVTDVHVSYLSIVERKCNATMYSYVWMLSEMPFPVTLSELKFDLHFDNPHGALCLLGEGAEKVGSTCFYKPKMNVLFDRVVEPNSRNKHNRLPMTLYENTYNYTAVELSTGAIAKEERHNDVCFRLNRQYKKEKFLQLYLRDASFRYAVGDFESTVEGIELSQQYDVNSPSCQPTPVATKKDGVISFDLV